MDPEPELNVKFVPDPEIDKKKKKNWIYNTEYNPPKIRFWEDLWGHASEHLKTQLLQCLRFCGISFPGVVYPTMNPRETDLAEIETLVSWSPANLKPIRRRGTGFEGSDSLRDLIPQDLRPDRIRIRGSSQNPTTPHPKKKLLELVIVFQEGMVSLNWLQV